MAIMFGDGNVDTTLGTGESLLKTIQWTAKESNSTAPTTFEVGGKTYPITGGVTYDAAGASTTSWSAGDTLFTTGTLTAKAIGKIEISANSFPGTYYVTGDTYARSEATGADEFFQFIIPKAKMQAENTITLEAEGDPSVFNMSLRVLRPSDGKMMKLVKYDMNVSVGKLMSFEVKKNSDTQISLRPLFENLQQQSNILKAMEAASIPQNEKTTQLVKEMMNSGMSVDKNTTFGILCLIAKSINFSFASIFTLKHSFGFCSQ